MIDIHSHILPGVDDGARTVADSVDIVRELSRSGITDIVATPHYVTETAYISKRERNQELLFELRSALLEESIDVNIFLGNEIYIDHSVAELISNGLVATMAGGSYVLVELPLNGEYPNYKDILSDLIGCGFNVILAHPERYAITQENYDILLELNEIGVLFQANLGSIMGQYGRTARKLVKKLLKDDLIFAFGSDNHYCHGADFWIDAQKRIGKICSERQLKQVLVTNPRKIISM